MKPEQEQKDYRKIETLGDIVYHKKHGAGRIITMSDWTYSMETGVTFFNGSRVDCYIGIDGMDHRDLVPIEVGIHKLLAALEEAQQQLTGKNEEIETAYDALDKLQKEFDQLDKGAADDYQRLAEAQQTIARQREALEFYAKKDHWELPQFGRGHSRITSDGGSKARELIRETQP
ncbi:hypothetical protein D3C81_173650 [compost metagenome]